MTLTLGSNAIINKKSGTALTGSDGPNPRAITGSQYDGTQNQKWDLFEKGENIWEIHKMGSEDFVGVLGGLRPGSEIFAVHSATRWEITHASGYGPHHYHISPLDIGLRVTGLRVTLANDGSSAPGTPVKLEPFSEDFESQVWEIRYLDE